MDDAVSYVKKFQGDYNHVYGKLETLASNNILFYRWQKFIYPLLVEQMFTNTGKMALTARLYSLSWLKPEARILSSYLSPQDKSQGLVYVGGENLTYAALHLPITTGLQGLYGLNRTLSEGDIGATPLVSSPLTSLAYMAYTGQDPYYRTNITDPFTAGLNIMGFGRIISTAKYATDENNPALNRILGLTTGVKLKSGVSLLAYSNFLDKTNEKVVNNSIRRLGGRFHGCGF